MKRVCRQFCVFLLCGLATAAYGAPKKKAPVKVTPSAKPWAPESEAASDAAAPTVNSAPSETASAGGASRSTPFALNPSPFEEILDQISLPTNPPAKILRVSRPFIGGTYVMASGSYKSSLGGTTTKSQLDGSLLGLEFIYPTPLGVRVGGYYSQVDARLKTTGGIVESTVKAPVTSKGVLVAAAFRNGFGAGLAFNDVEEKVSVEGFSQEETYGYILPSLYYATSNDEFTLTHRRSMRHKTGTTNGYFAFEMEHRMDGMNALFKLQNNRRSENDSGRRDNYEIGAGGRFFLEQKSFVTGFLEYHEPYYDGSSEATVFSVAEIEMSVTTDYWVAPEHVVGGGISYALSQGKGAEVAGERTKLEGSTLTFGASYSYRM